MASRIDSILDGTGLSGHGRTILEYAQGYGVNPAFALAMFRKEAEFAKPGSIAHRQNNPGNIICGGGATPLYGATGCGGRFGIYDTMADGIRAYFWLLDSEYKPGRKYNCEDIPCIIAVYCPPSDCDTARYVGQVTEWTMQYQNLLSTGSPLVLEPGPTVPSIAVTVVPATVIPESSTPTCAPTSTPIPVGTPRGTVFPGNHIDWASVPRQWGTNLLQHAQIVETSQYFLYLSDEDIGCAEGVGALNDGDPLTKWVTSSGRFPHWIVFELANEAIADRIGFVNGYTGHRGADGNNYAKAVEVLVASGDTPEDFQKVGDFQLMGAQGNPPPSYQKLQPYSFAPVRVKYVKIVFTSNYFDQSLYTRWPRLLDYLGVALAEVALFGSPH